MNIRADRRPFKRSAASYAVLSVSFIVFLIAAASMAYFAAIILADPLLTVRDDVQKADAMVVLGGDGPTRATRAAELWNEGVAPAVVIAGDGDCTYIADQMVSDGVDRAQISLDCLSRDTWENAKNAIDILEKMGVKHAVVVTNWFHSRRALDTFRYLEPSIEWSSRPAEPPADIWAIVFGPYGPAIAKEYVKSIAYGLQRAAGGLFYASSIGKVRRALS